MTRRQLIFLTLSAMATLLLTAIPASALTRAELKERFKGRYPAILQLKDAGTVGETSTGFLEAVNAEKLDAGARSLIDADNGDRRELYRIIAEEQKTTPDKVAQANAERNFQKAAPGHYLKGPDGTWKRKG